MGEPDSWGEGGGGQWPDYEYDSMMSDSEMLEPEYYAEQYPPVMATSEVR